MLEGLKSVFKQGWMSFSAIITISVALSLASVLFVVVKNVDATTYKLENDIKIVVRLDDDAVKDDVIKKIKTDSNVSEIDYKTKDESLENIKKQYGDGKIFDSYNGANNPLKNVLYVRVKDKTKIEDTAKKIGPTQDERRKYEETKDEQTMPEIKVPGVYDVESGGTTTKKIVDVFSAIRLFGVIIIGFVLVVAFVLISNTIRMTIVARRNQIQIMRLVGASSFFIRMPFFFEGIFIGILGSVIPVATIVFGYSEFVNSQKTAQLSSMQFLPANQIVYSTAIYIVIIGVCVGAFASLMSITRYLRK